MKRPFFGIDAPPIVVGYGLFGLAGIVLIVLEAGFGAHLAGVGYWMAAVGLLTSGAMLHSSLRGKIRLRDRLLARLDLQPEHDVLDLGCGSGLMLLGAAVRAPKGIATGIDLWRGVDQAGSNRDRCLRNAEILGVADRVRLVDGDMSELPLEDDSVDVVLATLSIHNIHDRSKRERTVREAARVLRPGGTLAIVDFTRTAEYARTAADAGLSEVDRSGLRWSIYPPVRVVTARKPRR
ncbi:class I SAM-dependent methyltransferase [Amycolatopsis pigmentata]|uniref:Class I SAM-dependent methyltransferase n=1 Tax=Amycolatopsis pigmentata TaxID=450801 RepID=A0ABW5FR12_9PSEU